MARGLDMPFEELAPGPPRPLRDGPAVYAEFASRSRAGWKPLVVP